MADWLACPDAVKIRVPEAINEENVTWYEIQVQVADISWRKRRRFREFVELHDSLIDHGVDKERSQTFWPS